MPKRSPASSKALALAPILLCLVPLAFWSARSFVGGAGPRVVAYSDLASEVEAEDRLCVLLGGRTAEELACGTISTGAQDDLERATAIARQMVCRFGMSDALGPLTWGHNHGLRLVGGPEVVERNYSEETARAIDAEVRRIVEVSHTRAAGLLGARRAALDAIGRALLVRETLERGKLEALAGTTRRLATAAVA